MHLQPQLAPEGSSRVSLSPCHFFTGSLYGANALKGLFFISWEEGEDTVFILPGSVEQAAVLSVFSFRPACRLVHPSAICSDLCEEGPWQWHTSAEDHCPSYQILMKLGFFPSKDALEGSEVSPAVMGVAVKDEMLFTCSGGLAAQVDIVSEALVRGCSCRSMSVSPCQGRGWRCLCTLVLRQL
ncbi:uncharacterized protein LOC129208217 [Grus americana]|uniref:uncharacterized protein LOC129208217 n=1 Tax=Grus americana TaxID=9117 RepID=UPI002408124C|nr:uncharacterized protein LOC129208217 [Grus americana]